MDLTDEGTGALLEATGRLTGIDADDPLLVTDATSVLAVDPVPG